MHIYPIMIAMWHIHMPTWSLLPLPLIISLLSWNEWHVYIKIYFKMNAKFHILINYPLLFFLIKFYRNWHSFNGYWVSCVILTETHMDTFFVSSKVVNCLENIEMGNLNRDFLLTIDNFTTTLFDRLDRLSSHQQLLAIVLLWIIWKIHDANLQEAYETSSTFIISRPKDTLQEWSCI